MSGIFGVYSRDTRPVSDQELTKMKEVLHHRGVDGQRTWNDEVVGMGHCMLKSTPESENEAMPFQDPESGLVITADARIDNRVELFSSLKIEKHGSKGIPDSLLILEAYKRWGSDCVFHLLGDFAFAIWDQRRKKLFCVRDQLGVKPFYYYSSRRFFIFASEAQAIAALSFIDVRLNEDRIGDFLVNPLEGIDHVSTFFREIYRLPPANRIEIEPGKENVSKYWQLERVKELNLSSDREYEEAFEEILTHSIRARLRSKTDPALLLSGGIDSSLIAAIAGKVTGHDQAEQLTTYSGISNNADGCLESEYITKVLAHTGIKGEMISPSQLSQSKGELLHTLGCLPEPFDMSMVLHCVLYLAAQKANHRVVLDGIDGDIIASLSPAYPVYLFRQGLFKTAFNETAALSKTYYHGNVSVGSLLMQYGRKLFVPGWLRQVYKPISQARLTKNAVKESLIRASFAGRIHLAKRLQKLVSHSYTECAWSLREKHVYSICHPFLTVALERYDRVAARCSIEPRHPLLDRRLVEFCIALPWHQLVRAGQSKSILRRTAVHFLPEEICNRHSVEHLGWDFTSTLFRLIHKEIEKEIRRFKKELGRSLDVDLLLKEITVEKGIEGITDPTLQLKVWETYSLAILFRNLLLFSKQKR